MRASCCFKGGSPFRKRGEGCIAAQTYGKVWETDARSRGENFANSLRKTAAHNKIAPVSGHPIPPSEG